MGLVLPTIEAYQVQHLPIVKAYADKIGVVEVINQLVPTEMGIDPGTIVLGMILDTLSGRSPLYRLEEFLAHQDTRPCCWAKPSRLTPLMMTPRGASWIASMTWGP